MKKLLSIVSLITAILSFQDAAHAEQQTDFVAKESMRCMRQFAAYEREYSLPSHLLQAISAQESGRWSKEHNKMMPWPWTINVQGKGYYFPSKKAAINAVEKFRKSGIQSIDVGCMQVNLYFHPEAFSNLDQAFDPAINVGYSGKLLRDHYDREASWKQAVSDYHTGSGGDSAEAKQRGKQYASKVLAFWRAEINEMIERNRTQSRARKTLTTATADKGFITLASVQPAKRRNSTTELD